MPPGTCDLDDLLKLTTDTDKLEGTLQVAPIGSHKGLNEEAVTAYLGGQGVQGKAIQKQAILDLIKEVLEAPLESHEAVVAVGTPAINGDSVLYTLTPEIAAQIDRIQARLDAIKSGSLTQDQAPDEPDPASDPEAGSDPVDSGSEEGLDEKVSYYDQMSYVVVEKGDVIAMKSKRSAGFDGSTIFGTVIPAKEGKANEGILDDSIRVSKDGECTAAFAGLLNASPSNISVSTELEIRGDVDFTSGRIIFPGTVIVQGAVRDHFSVRALDDVTINGLVECSRIESGQNITLTRGMAGKETGTIVAGGDLDAGYLEGVQAQVRGKVSARREITNCVLDVLGELDAPQAAIRGGTLNIAKGAVIGAAGSAQGVETELVVGSIAEIEDRIKTSNDFLERLEKQHTQKLKKLETFSSAIAKPTPSQIEEQMGMQFEVDEIADRIKSLDSAKKNLGRLLLDCSSARIEFTKAVYPKVELYIPGYKIEFKQELLGETIIELGQTGRPTITHRGEVCELKDLARVVPDERILRVLPDDVAMASGKQKISVAN